MNAQTAINKIWLDYYHKLTRNEGAPHYDESSNLFHWIAEHSRDHQTKILEMCYEAGYKAGMLEQREDIEDHVVMLERACAVLSEVEDYFVLKDNAKLLPHYADHILLLLHVAGGLLFDSRKELEAVISKSYDAA